MKKNASDNIPSFQFYPNDWLADVNLRLCSLPARGLWIDLVCLMYRTKKVGYLVHKVDKKWINFDSKMVQKVTGISQKKVNKLLQELIDNEVLKLDDNGLIYSKRIVKDQELSNIRREAGKKGGNPDLLKQKDKQKKKQKQTPSSSASLSPSSSASLSPSSSKKEINKNLDFQWQEILKKIEAKVKPESFDTWFSPISVLAINDKLIELIVPNTLSKNFLTDNYSDLISEALDGREVSFVVVGK